MKEDLSLFEDAPSIETRGITLRLPEDDEELAMLAWTDTEYASGPASIVVEMLGPDRMRIVEPCAQLYPRVLYGDVIRVRELEDGSYRWLETLERPPMRELVYSGSFTPGFWDRPSVRRILGKVVDAGGQWEFWLGSRLSIMLPENDELIADCEEWFDGVIEREQRTNMWGGDSPTLSPGTATVKWLYEEQLQVDERWSKRWPDGFVWWADHHAQAIEVVGTSRSPSGSLGELVQIRTEVARDVQLGDPLLEALQAGFMAYASLAGPVFDAERGTLSLCSLIRVHEDIRHWLQPILSMAAMLQIAEGRSLGSKLAERFGLEPAVGGHPDSGPRPEPDELAIAVPGRLIAMGEQPCRWRPEEFTSTLERLKAVAPDFRDPTIVQEAVAEAGGIHLRFPYGRRSSSAWLTADRSHPKYGNGLTFLQSFPTIELSPTQGARLAMLLNRRHLVDDVVGYGVGSYFYFDGAMLFTSFFPNMLYGISLLQNLCLSAVDRAEVVGRYLVEHDFQSR